MTANPHLFAGLGAALAVFLAAAGACCASVPAGRFALRAQGGGLLAFVPMMQSGVLAIYGCVLGVILALRMEPEEITQAQGYRYFCSGLALGLSCLASGVGMARFVDSYMMDGGEQQPVDNLAAVAPLADTNTLSERESLIPNNNRSSLKPTKKFIMVLIFFESIGLYGLIVSLFLIS